MIPSSIIAALAIPLQRGNNRNTQGVVEQKVNHTTYVIASEQDKITVKLTKGSIDVGDKVLLQPGANDSVIISKVPSTLQDGKRRSRSDTALLVQSYSGKDLSKLLQTISKELKAHQTIPEPQEQLLTVLARTSGANPILSSTAQKALTILDKIKYSTGVNSLIIEKAVKELVSIQKTLEKNQSANTSRIVLVDSREPLPEGLFSIDNDQTENTDDPVNSTTRMLKQTKPENTNFSVARTIPIDDGETAVIYIDKEESLKEIQSWSKSLQSPTLRSLPHQVFEQLFKDRGELRLDILNRLDSILTNSKQATQALRPSSDSNATIQWLHSVLDSGSANESVASRMPGPISQITETLSRISTLMKSLDSSGAIMNEDQIGVTEESVQRGQKSDVVPRIMSQIGINLESKLLSTESEGAQVNTDLKQQILVLFKQVQQLSSSVNTVATMEEWTNSPQQRQSSAQSIAPVIAENQNVKSAESDYPEEQMRMIQGKHDPYLMKRSAAPDRNTTQLTSLSSSISVQAAAFNSLPQIPEKIENDYVLAQTAATVVRDQTNALQEKITSLLSKASSVTLTIPTVNNEIQLQTKDGSEAPAVDLKKLLNTMIRQIGQTLTDSDTTVPVENNSSDSILSNDKVRSLVLRLHSMIERSLGSLNVQSKAIKSEQPDQPSQQNEQILRVLKSVASELERYAVEQTQLKPQQQPAPETAKNTLRQIAQLIDSTVEDVSSKTNPKAAQKVISEVVPQPEVQPKGEEESKAQRILPPTRQADLSNLGITLKTILSSVNAPDVLLSDPQITVSIPTFNQIEKLVSNSLETIIRSLSSMPTPGNNPAFSMLSIQQDQIKSLIDQLRLLQTINSGSDSAQNLNKSSESSVNQQQTIQTKESEITPESNKPNQQSRTIPLTFLTKINAEIQKIVDSALLSSQSVKSDQNSIQKQSIPLQNQLKANFMNASEVLRDTLLNFNKTVENRVNRSSLPTPGNQSELNQILRSTNQILKVPSVLNELTRSALYEAGKAIDQELHQTPSQTATDSTPQTQKGQNKSFTGKLDSIINQLSRDAMQVLDKLPSEISKLNLPGSNNAQISTVIDRLMKQVSTEFDQALQKITRQFENLKSSVQDLTTPPQAHRQEQPHLQIKMSTVNQEQSTIPAQPPQSDSTVHDMLRQPLETLLNRIESLQLLARQVPTSNGEQQILSLPMKIGGEWTEVQVRFVKKDEGSKKRGAEQKTFSVYVNVAPSGTGSIASRMDYDKDKSFKLSMEFEKLETQNWFTQRRNDLQNLLLDLGLPAPRVEMRLAVKKRELPVGNMGINNGELDLTI